MTSLVTIRDRLDIFRRYITRSNLDFKQYQADGVEWCITNELNSKPLYNVRGGFIADEMGLGKTILMIGTCLANQVPTTLIVVPPILIQQWVSQIFKTTGHKALVFHGPYKKKITHDHIKQARIVITSYGAISLSKTKIQNGGRSILHNMDWSRIIFDEAHHLRNSTSKFYGAKLLKSNIRWLVSGTPIQNKKHDFYNLCSVLTLPASFYTENSNLRTLARTFILKRTKLQANIKMTDIISTHNIIDWKHPKEQELSEYIHSTLDFSNVPVKPDAITIHSVKYSKTKLSNILKARQICTFPKLIQNSFGDVPAYYNDAFQQSSKLDTVIDTVVANKDNSNGKLIFCNFKLEITEIYNRLTHAGFQDIAIIDGTTSHSQKTSILNSKHDILILQIQTCCEGLNLQEHFSEVYFVSPNWNPFIEEQAIARCHRLGQIKDVHVFRFQMNNFPSVHSLPSLKPTVSVDKYITLVQDNKKILASLLV
jgi:SNF2 family DNA or RNA helicase